MHMGQTELGPAIKLYIQPLNSNLLRLEKYIIMLLTYNLAFVYNCP